MAQGRPAAMSGVFWRAIASAEIDLVESSTVGTGAALARVSPGAVIRAVTFLGKSF
jgi:hypothetical protein